MPKNSCFPHRLSKIPAISKLDSLFFICLENLDACIRDDLFSSRDFDYYRMFACAMITLLVTGECDHLNISNGDADE